MKYLLLFVLGVALMPLSVKADVMPSNHHVIENCVVLENASDFPDYTFKLVGSQHFGKGDYVVDETLRCNVPLYGSQLIAIKNDDLSKIVSNYSASNPEAGDNWWELRANQGYFISSGLMVNFDKFLPDTSKTTKVTQAIHVDSISEVEYPAVHAYISRTITEDGAGHSTAISSTNSGLDSKTLGIGLFVGVGLLGIILAIKAGKK